MRFIPVLYRRVALAIVILISVPIVILAQADSGRISGTVKDQNGAIVPGATIVAKNERTGDERTTTSNVDGTYSVTNLKPSNYTLTVTASGLSQTLTGIQVLVGEEFKLDVTVKTQEVTLNETSASIGANVNPREVQTLPLNGRQLSQLYLQAPGSVNTGSGTFGDIRFSGRAVQQNVIRYDGIEGSAIIDASPGNLNGEVPSPFRLQSSLENVQEFRVDSNNFPAEFGTG